MAIRLEQMLRPGERRLYETPYEKQPAWLSVGSVPRLLLSLGAALAVALVAFESGIARIIAAVFILLLLAPTYLRRAGRIVSVVTEQRAFTLDTADAEFISAPVELFDVRAVELFAKSVRVTKADGGTVLLMGNGDAPDLAAALARAAGLTPPPSGRRVERASKALEYVFLLGVFVMSVAGNKLLPADFHLFEGSSTAVVHSLALVAVALVWMIAVGMIGLVLLRPFHSREELRQIVLSGGIFFSHPFMPKALQRIPRLYLRFVDWLYGGPKAPEPQGHGHDG